MMALIKGPSLAAIECHELELVTEALLANHYVHRKYDNALSQRILDQLLIEIDPGKLVFFQSDVDEFKEEFGNEIDLWLFARSCGFLEVIQDQFYLRTEERFAQIQALIDEEHDYTLAESYLRPRSRNYLNDEAAFSERWRKQIKYQILQSRLTGLNDEEIRGKLHRYYQARFTANDRLPDEVLRDKFLKAFARSLDPHTKYYPPANAADIRIALGETFFGIGATIETRNESFFIARLNPGGPAFQSKALEPGDQILAVTSQAGEPIEAFGKTLTELVHLIRGPKDSPVELTIHRQTDQGNLVKKVPIIRDRIDPVAAAAERQSYLTAYEGDPTSSIRIGLISLSSFYLDRAAQRAYQSDYRSAARDVERLIKELESEGIDSLILDLRGNGGGLLSEAVSISGLFIPSGPIIQKQDAFDDIIILNDRDKRTIYQGPLTLIIEPQSASASEIVAGTLQDYRRALVVGTGNTYGKGTVQIVASVHRQRAELGSYKLTNALYFLPSGRTPQLHGITPDILLPTSQFGTRTMADREFAIEAKQLDPISFTPTAPGNHHIAPLQARSDQRTEQRHPKPLSKNDSNDEVSLQESTYNTKQGAEQSLNKASTERTLKEVLRITFDRYRLHHHLPLSTAPIEVDLATTPSR